LRTNRTRNFERPESTAKRAIQAGRTMLAWQIAAGLAVLAGALALQGPARLWASQTQFWQVGAFDEFLQGTLHDVSLNQEGSLQLAPPTEAYFDPEQSLAFSLTSDRDGRFYVGTGHQGKVFRVDAQGQGKLLFQASEPEILAIASGPDGNLYAASSPEGKIYRVTPEGKSSVFFDPKQKYIWSLVFDGRGRLYAGTGDAGKIYEVDPDGKGRVFFDSLQTHVICMAFDGKGNLLAGSDPNGLIFRISPEGKGFVLYKADFPEVHALALAADGHIYAAALGGNGATPTSPFFMPPVQVQPQPASVTTVTVTASGGNEPAEAEDADAQQTPTPQPPPPHAPALSEHLSPSFNRGTAPSAFTPPSSPQGRGALIRIAPDNSAETLWTSDRESIFGLALEGRNVLFSTDGSGRIFRLSPSADGPLLTLMTETREAQATRLLVEGSNVYVATSNVARLFRLGSGAAHEGSYESPVKDAKFVSHWGGLSWRSQAPAGGSLQLYTRSGNSEHPDATWSDWEGPYSNADGSQVSSPSARYIQWKAVFKGKDGETPVLDDVTLAYLNENLPPELHALDVNASGGSLPSGVPNIAVGNPGASPGDHKTTIAWQADDPNGDRLVYSLYLRASDEREWHLVKAHLHENNYGLDGPAVPDGEYVARVVASDEESNPPGQARRSELVSAPFWIVNTPPRVEVSSQQARGASAEVHFHASTEISPLRAAEVSVDGSPWKPVAADDGIIDSRSETFTVSLPQLAPGEHEVLLRATDVGGNTGIGRAVLGSGAGSSGN
jgi:sugar lactone lactonase YvrE